MKTLIEYQCEICSRKHSTADDALACEARGRFDMSKVYPVGMILASNKPGDLYEKMTFAVAVYGKSDGKHTCNFHCWACRDTGPAGDTLGDDTCGCWSHADLGTYYAQVDPERPSFKRMVAYLQSKGIAVTVWDGARPVPLGEWLEPE